MTKTKKQTMEEHMRTHNERQLAVLAINLAVAIAKASSIGHSLRALHEVNPRYVAHVSDDLKALNQGYRTVRAKVANEVAQFYNTQIQGVLGDHDIREGLNKWGGGLAVII